MDYKQEINNYVQHLKSKWFVYFVVVMLVIVLWFVLIWGQATKVPASQTLFVWLTPSTEYSEDAAENYLKIDDTLNYIYKNKDKYGYKKYKQKTAYASKTNNEEINTFTWYADGSVDLFFMPTTCFVNDIEIFENLDNVSDYEIMKYSNSNYCNRFIDLYDLYTQEEANYEKYILLLQNLESKGLLVKYVGVDNNKNYLPQKVAGIKINEDYVLSISKYHTTQKDKLYDLIYDIVKDL